MKSIVTSMAAAAALVLLAGTPSQAANNTPVTPAKKSAAKSAAVRSAWPAETLSGKIIAVEPNQRLVVVQGPDGVPFDMVTTSRTHIRSGDTAVSIGNLSQYENQHVMVRFIPERRGDVAESIRISS